MRHPVAIAAVLLGVALFTAGTASAATFDTAPTDRQLLDRAETVLVARVVATAARESADRMIYTDATLRVEQVLKGNVTRDTVTVSELGGFANGHGVVVPGSATYASGSRVVAFLRQRDDGTYFTADMALGLYRFEKIDGADMLVRDTDGIEVESNEALAARPAQEMIAYLRDGAPLASPRPALIETSARREFQPVTNASAGSYAIKATAPSVLPLRWDCPGPGTCTRTWTVGAPQAGSVDTPTAVEHAMAAWTDDTNSWIRLDIGGLNNHTGATNDDINDIVFNSNDNAGLTVCDGSLGCTIIWHNGVQHTFDGDTFYKIVSSDVIIRPVAFTQSSFEGVLAHELGHAIGFRHSNQGTPSSTNALMNSSVPSGATLRAWDKEAVAEMYGNGLPCSGPGITSTTSSGTVPSGNTKNLSVNASGTAPLNYQWYEGNSGTTTTPVGTNSSSFTTPPITQPRSFWVRVTNACGVADSDTITISPSSPTCTPPAVTLQPLSQSIISGSTANLTVDASGTATLSYQWYQGAVGDTTIPVSSSKSFTTPPLNATTTYWVRVTNACGTANSNLATITVSQACIPASITTQPINTDAALGEGITLVIGTAGTAPISVQWYTGDSPNTASPIVDATTTSYAAGPFTTSGTFKFWAKVTNACGTANGATITVNVACGTLFLPLISAPPATPATVGYDVTWSGNTPALVSNYELQEATNADFTANLREFVITGATVQHIPAHGEITTDTRFYYRVRATNACNGVKTNYSTPTSTLVTAPLPANSTSFSISVPEDINQSFLQDYLVPGFEDTSTNNDTFSIAIGQNCRPDLLPECVPWLTVFPQNGALSAGGTTVQLTFNTTGLDVGTLTTTIVVNRTNGAGKTGANRVSSNGTTPPINIPFSVSLVTPVTPAPRSATAPPGTLIIPAVAHADGIGTRFQSDVRIANTSDQAITYQISFTPSGLNGTQVGKQTTLTIGAKDTKGLDDVVKAWYGSGLLGEAGVGTLEIRPTGDANPLATFASSRTYAISSAGTLGQFIPAIPLAQFVGNIADNPLARLSLQQVANSAAYRTNFGFVEGGGQNVEMLIKLLDGNNNVLQSVTKSLQPYEHQQVSFASIFGNVPVNDARVEVSTNSGNGKITAYASVVDNKTSDPLLVFPVQAAATTSQHYVAPGIAELNNGASNFHSDMRVYNGGQAAVDVALKYFPQGSSTPNATTVTRSILPGQVLAIDNVLPELWSLNASGGAVTVDAPPNSSLVVTARTYSRDTAGGTFGQFIPGVTSREAVGFGERSLELMQLEESAQYRTNLGLVEVTGNAVDLEISAYKPDTKITTVVPFHLDANQFQQLGLVFSQKFQMPTVYNGRISIKVVGGQGRVAAYGSVVDNRTIDPTYVPAQ
jgi:Ig-like domain-containing protein/matrixin